MTDGFAYLVNAGWPLERLQWYMRNGVDMSEMADSVQGMVESRRFTMKQLIQEDNGEEPPPAAGSLFSLFKPLEDFPEEEAQ